MYYTIASYNRAESSVKLELNCRGPYYNVIAANKGRMTPPQSALRNSGGTVEISDMTASRTFEDFNEAYALYSTVEQKIASGELTPSEAMCMMFTM